MKNEAHLIEEWLSHYLEQGADHIFLIDNGSTDDTLSKIAPFQRDGRVEVVTYPDQHRQQHHYWNAFRHFRISERCEWLAIADIDEFWFCKSGELLRRYLVKQAPYDALYANWTMFGSSGFEEQPASVRLSLVQKDPRLARQTKCIFRTSLPVRENDIEVHLVRNALLRRSKIANREIQLNHYATQSRDFWFKVKMRRGDVFYSSPDLSEMASRFERINDACTETCLQLRTLLVCGFE